MDDEPLPLLLGRSGRLQAVPLTNTAGDHAVLLREAEQPRALLTSEGGDERIVLMPLDDRTEVRSDADALAVWLAQGSLHPTTGSALAGWASAIGLVILLALAALAILGSFTFFGWLFRSLGVG